MSTKIIYQIGYHPVPVGNQAPAPLRYDQDYLTLRQALDRALVLTGSRGQVQFIQKLVGETEADRLQGDDLMSALDKRRRDAEYALKNR